MAEEDGGDEVLHPGTADRRLCLHGRGSRRRRCLSGRDRTGRKTPDRPENMEKGHHHAGRRDHEDFLRCFLDMQMSEVEAEFWDELLISVFND